jgi:CheY-like chemotaxis protein
VSRNRLKVLVVDDDPIVLEATRERLEAAGHDVLVRDSPVGTAALVYSERVDIVVLDILMPGLRGDDLARLLKRNPTTVHTAILLHSSLRSEELRPLIMSTGALGALEKSWGPAEFHVAFSRYVNRLLALRATSTDSAPAASQDVPASSATGALLSGQIPPSSHARLKAGQVDPASVPKIRVNGKPNR